MDISIDIQNVSKIFNANKSYSTTFKLITGKLLRKSVQSNSFHALKNISLNVSKGEKIGLVGNNGSGKSTLLRLVAGLYAPSEGQIIARGKIVLLAGWGIGMVEELSVAENVFLLGTIYGMDKRDIRSNFEDIILWAELQDFVNAKVKTLSTGMKTRLAFSISRYIEADIFLLDEALSAGDKKFMEKCREVFEQYKKSDKTFMVASHDQTFVESFCGKSFWLSKGEGACFGDTESVLRKYNEANGW